MFVWRPARCDGPCPVVVELHGGPEAQSRPGFSTKARLYVDAGFTFVQPNVRGSTGYGKAWLHPDDGAKRLNVISDNACAILNVRRVGIRRTTQRAAGIVIARCALRAFPNVRRDFS